MDYALKPMYMTYKTVQESRHKPAVTLRKTSRHSDICDACDLIALVTVNFSTQATS